nr:unnamed protein product [Callosobruchus analis]
MDARAVLEIRSKPRMFQQMLIKTNFLNCFEVIDQVKSGCFLITCSSNDSLLLNVALQCTHGSCLKSECFSKCLSKESFEVVLKVHFVHSCSLLVIEEMKSGCFLITCSSNAFLLLNVALQCTHDVSAMLIKTNFLNCFEGTFGHSYNLLVIDQIKSGCFLMTCSSNDSLLLNVALQCTHGSCLKSECFSKCLSKEPFEVVLKVHFVHLCSLLVIDEIKSGCFLTT